MWNPATDAAYQIVLWNTPFVVPISDPPPTVQAEWFRILHPFSTCSGRSAEWSAPSKFQQNCRSLRDLFFPAWINWPSVESHLCAGNRLYSLKYCIFQTGALCEHLQLVNIIYCQHAQCWEIRNCTSYAFFVVQIGKQEGVKGLKGAVMSLCPFTWFISETLKFRWICGGLLRMSRVFALVF